MMEYEVEYFGHKVIVWVCQRIEILFSGFLDLEHVGWRVLWIPESLFDGINIPHDECFSFIFSIWG